MIMITENGPVNLGVRLLTPYKVPAAIVAAERTWRNAWNASAADFNLLVERTQTRYNRMMDVNLLPMIADDSVKIPAYTLLK
jgi:hypothetical protein